MLNLIYLPKSNALHKLLRSITGRFSGAALQLPLISVPYQPKSTKQNTKHQVPAWFFWVDRVDAMEQLKRFYGAFMYLIQCPFDSVLQRLKVLNVNYSKLSIKAEVCNLDGQKLPRPCSENFQISFQGQLEKVRTETSQKSLESPQRVPEIFQRKPVEEPVIIWRPSVTEFQTSKYQIFLSE